MLTDWAVGYRGALVRWAVLTLTLLALSYVALNARALGISRPEFLDFSGAGPVVYVLVNLLIIGTIMALLAAYIVDVIANPRLGWTARTIWIVALALGNILAMPIYWAVHLHRKHLAPDSRSRAGV
jgi:hypothetical protein